MDRFDYAAAANVWLRVDPQAEPYPHAERGRFEGAVMPSAPPAPRPLPPVMSGMDNGGGGEMCRALLREEMRHMQQVLSALEKALA